MNKYAMKNQVKYIFTEDNVCCAYWIGLYSPIGSALECEASVLCSIQLALTRWALWTGEVSYSHSRSYSSKISL